MTSNHFFIKKSQVGGVSLCLEGPEHHHLSRVARLQPHDKIWLFDEEGTKYRARIEDIGRQKTRLRLLEKTAADKKLFLSEHSGRPLKDVLRLTTEAPAAPPDVMILAGPEGGWTAEEEKSVLGWGYEAVSVSKNVLKAETASLAAVAIIAHFWDREYVSPGTKSR